MPAVTAYRFEVGRSVPLDEAELTLHLAMIALEGLFGRAGVRLEARYRLDAASRAIVVDGGGRVGSALVRVFAALLLREFGDDAFSVRRVAAGRAPLAEPVLGVPQALPAAAAGVAAA